MVKEAYTIPITQRLIAKGKKNLVASVKTGKTKRKKPYPPNFNNKPAKITEPIVGASTCASGNQI